MKLYKQVTTIVPHDWTWYLFAIYLCEVAMKNDNDLFVYMNPENNDSVEDVPGLNNLYKESTSKLIFDSYSFLAQSLVNIGKHWWICSFNNIYSQLFI